MTSKVGLFWETMKQNTATPINYFRKQAHQCLSSKN